MAKCTCSCGQPMHDHNVPDENFYRVFSDVEWHAIETDDFYNVYDLEHADNRIIKECRTLQEYQEPWNDAYYEKLKSRIDMYVKGEIRE